MQQVRVGDDPHSGKVSLTSGLGHAEPVPGALQHLYYWH